MILWAAIFLMASVPCLVFRLVKGPELTDRLLAADLLGLCLASGILLLAKDSGENWDMDAIWVLLSFTFFGTLGASILMEHDHE